MRGQGEKEVGGKISDEVNFEAIGVEAARRQKVLKTLLHSLLVVFIERVRSAGLPIGCKEAFLVIEAFDAPDREPEQHLSVGLMLSGNELLE